MTWKLYAFKYGSQPDLKADETTILANESNSDQPLEPFYFFFWLAKSAAGTVLIDCGFTAEQARIRGKTIFASPIDLLAEIGLGPEDIDHLILTHLHYDHAGNINEFINARIYVHSDEWDWALSSAMSIPEFAKYYDPTSISPLISCLYSDSLSLLTSRKSKVAGLEIERLGGHSPGQIIVHVPTEFCKFVLASDAAHLTTNLKVRSPFPIVHDVEKASAALCYLNELGSSGAIIVAGHDQRVFQRGRPVGTSGNVVELKGGDDHA